MIVGNIWSCLWRNKSRLTKTCTYSTPFWIRAMVFLCANIVASGLHLRMTERPITDIETVSKHLRFTFRTIDPCTLERHYTIYLFEKKMQFNALLSWQYTILLANSDPDVFFKFICQIHILSGLNFLSSRNKSCPKRQTTPPGFSEQYLQQ